MPAKLTKSETINLPTTYGNFKLTTYETDYSDQPNMKFVVVLESESLEVAPTVRVHSSCVFSEVFGSMLCDCAEQLAMSLEYIQKNGGILVYLDQEGRGHGIHTKTKELKLQEGGLDTVQASEELNLPIDAREYTVVGDILHEKGISEIKLLTNNPNKINKIKTLDIRIKERIPIFVEATRYNKRYLEAKKTKLGHMLGTR